MIPPYSPNLAHSDPTPNPLFNHRARRDQRLHPKFWQWRYAHASRLKQRLLAAFERVCSDQQFVKVRGKVLVDLGCGGMPYRPLLAPRVERYIGADLPANGVADVTIDPATQRADLEDGIADVVLSSQVLEHVAEPARYLQEVVRLLKPGGHVILSTHGRWLYHPDPQDHHRWTQAGLENQLQSAGLEIVHTSGDVGTLAGSIHLLQDGLRHRWPWLPCPLLAVVFQPLMLLAEVGVSDADRLANPLVYMVVAQRPTKGTS